MSSAITTLPYDENSIATTSAKTPAASALKSRRAFGDISNRKQQQQHPSTTTVQPTIKPATSSRAPLQTNLKAVTTIDKQPLQKEGTHVEFLCSSSQSVTSATKSSTGIAHATKLNRIVSFNTKDQEEGCQKEESPIEDIEKPAGRLWSQQLLNDLQHYDDDDSFDQEFTSSVRDDWVRFQRDCLEQENIWTDQEDERCMREMKEAVERLVDPDGT